MKKGEFFRFFSSRHLITWNNVLMIIELYKSFRNTLPVFFFLDEKLSISVLKRVLTFFFF